MSHKIWKLSPSDFAFLWQECPRCFYLKVVHQFNRPSIPMPKIFSKIDSQMKSYYAGKRTENILTGMPPGVIWDAGRWVESAPIQLTSHSTSCYIKGIFDTTIRLDDGSYALVDYKTSEAKPEHLDIYSRQLHAYAYALENPGINKYSLTPVSRLGLLVFDPHHFTGLEQGSASLDGDLAWQEMTLDYAAFLEFIGEVLDVLEQPTPPPAGEKCPYCEYRAASRQSEY